jgi:ABC-2 type transport system permease protein
VSGLLRIYRALLLAQFQLAAQYRLSMFLYVFFSVIRPAIFLAAWVAVASARGGSVGAYDVSDFAAYYIALTLVLHFTLAWNDHEFEFEIRYGRLSPKLLRPLHPLHYAVAENVTWKLFTAVALAPALIVIAITLDARFRTEPWHLVAFVPSLLVAAALGFFINWAVASVAFWTTRVRAVTTVMNRASFIFAGQIAPLSLMPGPLQYVAYALPFGYVLGVPAEILRGGVGPAEAVTLMAGQVIWLVIAYLVMRLMWRAGLRQYSAVGA